MTELEQILQEIKTIKNSIIKMIETMRVSGTQVVVQGLSEISGNLGLVNAGEFRSGTGYPGDSDKPFSGVRIGYPGFTYGGDCWNIAGVDSDTIQVGIRSCDGKLIAGGGTITLDTGGITILAEDDNSYGSSYAIEWIDTADNNQKVGSMIGYGRAAHDRSWLQVSAGGDWSDTTMNPYSILELAALSGDSTEDFETNYSYTYMDLAMYGDTSDTSKQTCLDMYVKLPRSSGGHQPLLVWGDWATGSDFWLEMRDFIELRGMSTDPAGANAHVGHSKAVRLYAKSDKLYYVDSSGGVHEIATV